MSKNTQNTKPNGTDCTLSDKKRKFIEVLEKNNFNVSDTCKKLKIARRTYYYWLEDEEFSQSIDDSKETEIDGVESELHKLIKAGVPSAIIFYLKTKGKKRGYIETQEVEITKPFDRIDLEGI